MSALETSERFLRPADVENIRRNYRGIQLRSLVRGGRKAILALSIIAIAVFAYRHTQSDARFAIKHVEISGEMHTRRAAVSAIASRYVGLNLFRLDIDRVRREVTALEWVRRIEIEKALPDTLRIRIVERTPAALIVRNGALRYVDENGVAFAELSPAAGDSDLPLIRAETPFDVRRAVGLIHRLRMNDPDVYARISEVRPLLPHGFALFDRELGATIYAEEEDLSAKWRDLHSIAAAEHFRKGDLQYADLRFDGRVILKPLHAVLGPAVSAPHTLPMQITN